MSHYGGNNAYRIKIEEREEQRLSRRDNPRYEKFIRDKKKKIMGVMAIIMAVALTAILRFAQISILNNEIQETRRSLEQAQAERTYLEIERDRIIDLSHISKIAKETYGMVTPKKDQIVYITVSMPDSVTVENQGLFASLFSPYSSNRG